MSKALSAVVLATLWLLPLAVRAEPPPPSESTPAQIEEAKAHFQRARDHLAAERFDEAVAEYQAAYQLYPDAEFLFNIGEAYRLKGDKRSAIEHFQRYLELEPEGRGAADARASIAKLEAELDAEAPPVEPPPGDTTTEPVADRVPVPLPPAYPAALVDRPLQLSRGQVEAAVATRALTGTYFNWDASEWQYGFARWVTLDLTARYGITDRIEAAVDLPLVAYRPDKEEFSDSPRYGAIGRVSYRVIPEVSVRVEGGVAGRQRIIRNRYQMPAIDYEMRPGFGLGATIEKRFGKLAISARPGVVIQLGSWYEEESECPLDDPDCWSTSLALHLPLAVHYQITPVIAAGLRTGIYSGHQVSFDKWKGASLPALAEALVTVAGSKLDLGLEAGFANLIDPDDEDPCCPTESSTFFLGLTAAYRNR